MIVPVYNVQEYIERCLDSLVNQTLKDIEIIVVNDGSTDKSPNICQKYAKKYKNIKYVSQKNKGLSGARNTGINIAKGEYLGFVDSDDFVEKDMFEFLYTNAKKYNSFISCCGHKTYYDDCTTKLNTKKGIEKFYNKEEALDFLLLQEYFDIISCNKIYKKELFENIRFPEGKIYEDMQTIYKLIYLSNGLYFNSDCKYFYYKRKNSISNSEFNSGTLNIINYVNEYVDFCEKNINKLKYIYIGQIRWYLVVINKMIACKKESETLINQLKKLIGNHLFLIITTNKLPFIRKLQICLFKLSTKLYKKIYIRRFCK